jgi:Uma2 family endonuclease
MQELAHRRMSPNAFFRWLVRQEGKYELVDGEPVAMAGADRRHNVVARNLMTSLIPQLKGGPCEPYGGDFAIQIPAGNIRYPDLSIDCGKTRDSSMVATKPTLVIEVLSPSTMRFDQTKKRDEYKSVPSLRAIVFVDPGVPVLRVLERSSDIAAWRSRLVRGLDEIAEIPNLGVHIKLRDIYDGLTFRPRPSLIIDDDGCGDT